MLATASKYSPVRPGASVPAGRGASRQGSTESRPTAPVQTSRLKQLSPHVLIKRFQQQLSLRQWFEQQLRNEDGYLFRYLRHEKLRSVERQRAVARRMHGFQQNNKSDFRLLAAVPAREFFRWQGEDEHFWDDNKNLKSLKRDNPDLPIFV